MHIAAAEVTVHDVIPSLRNLRDALDAKVHYTYSGDGVTMAPGWAAGSHSFALASVSVAQW
jgi:hypothetical protein